MKQNDVLLIGGGKGKRGEMQGEREGESHRNCKALSVKISEGKGLLTLTSRISLYQYSTNINSNCAKGEENRSSSDGRIRT